VRQATEIYSREFDSVFLKLPPRVRELVEAKIHDLGSHLSDFPHHRLKDGVSIGCVRATTESFTNSTAPRIFLV
jgi:hypothetical protein